MPTEHETAPPPVFEPSRASLSTCPPEERDLTSTLPLSRPHASLPDSAPASAVTPDPPTLDPTTTVSIPRVATPPVLDTQHRASDTNRQGDGSRNDHIEYVDVSADSPSPVGSPDTVSSDSDARLAQSLANTALRAPSEDAPMYLSYSQQRRFQPLPHSTSSFLHPGSKFRGTQQSDRQVYEVQVEIKDVDLAESALCGYLRIQGLTDDHPTLTTFFEGEIIGPKYLFKTEHPSWNSSEKIDLQHWARFPAWRPLAKAAKTSSTFTLRNYLEREHLFMRWKEYFLVPDHRVKSISGASFEGFYYICFDQRVGSVSGIYFHAKSEKYQQLELKHVPNGGCMGAVEFR